MAEVETSRFGRYQVLVYIGFGKLYLLSVALVRSVLEEGSNFVEEELAPGGQKSLEDCGRGVTLVSVPEERGWGCRRDLGQVAAVETAGGGRGQAPGPTALVSCSDAV